MSILRLFPSLAAIGLFFVGCARQPVPDLHSRLESIVNDAPGQIGVAVITPDGDTVTVNNDSVRYPLMSVFKLHQAIALCHVLDGSATGLDTVITIAHDELNPHTWSPLLADHLQGDVKMPLTGLLDYLLLYSDNNVSNILFDRFCSVAKTDTLIRLMTGDADFRLVYTEHEMQLDHDKAYDNWSTPRACVALIDRLFTDSLVSAPKQEFLISALKRCETGRERIHAAFPAADSVTVAHRTGSGYVNERGEVAAVNDVAHIILPDGRAYSIAVLVKVFAGTQEEAEKVMASISSEVYSYVKNSHQ